MNVKSCATPEKKQGFFQEEAWMRLVMLKGTNTIVVSMCIIIIRITAFSETNKLVQIFLVLKLQQSSIPSICKE